MEERLEQIIKEFSKLKDKDVADKTVADTVKQLQDYLCTMFPCDKEALLSFADLYRQSDFKKNIDTICTEGTAEFIADAIENYCIMG